MWRRGLAWLPGIILSLLLCELVLRLSGIGDPAATVGHRMEEQRARAGPMHGAYVPGSRLVYRYATDPFGTIDPDGTVTGSINTWGYRGAERPSAKPEGTLRIVALGDSFTLGYGVRDDETWPAQLEAALAEQRDGTVGGDSRQESSRLVEVLNFGVADADTRAEVNYLEGYALSFEPDLVLLALFLNDAGREATMTFLDPRKAPLPRVRRHSFLANLSLSELHRRRVGSRLIDHYRAGFQENSPGWRDVRTELRRAQGLCRSRGVAFVLLIYPILYQLERDYPFTGIHRTITDFARAEGIRCIDLLPVFAGRNERDLMVHPADPHPNATAHGLVVRQIVESGIVRFTP